MKSFSDISVQNEKVVGEESRELYKLSAQKLMSSLHESRHTHLHTLGAYPRGLAD